MKKIWFVFFSIIIILSSLFFVGFKNNDEINILHGKVVYVYDGDTIQLKTSDNKEYKIRLSGIDTPEYNQNYGKKSKAYLNSLICDKLVNIEVVGMDKYKRILAIIFHNNEDINYKMIKKGYAWHYKYYDSNQVYAEAEMEAKNKKLGLWQDEYPEAPWHFRHSKKHIH